MTESSTSPMAGDLYSKQTSNPKGLLGWLARKEKARNAIADKQLTTPAGYGLDSPALSEMLRKPTDSPRAHTTLLKLSPDASRKATSMSSMIQKFVEVKAEGSLTYFDVALDLLRQGLSHVQARDEAIMQLLRHTRTSQNPIPEHLERHVNTWELFLLVASTMPPSKEFLPLVTEYVHTICESEVADPAIQRIAQRVWSALRCTASNGPRKTLPSQYELECQLAGREMAVPVYLLDNSSMQLQYAMTATVASCLDSLAASLELQSADGFMLYESSKTSSASGDNTGTGSEEHLLLDEEAYLSDVLHSFRAQNDNHERCLLLKKRIFRAADESKANPRFIELCYLQVQHDYLSGRYPVDSADAARLCALQIQASVGSDLLDDSKALVKAVKHFSNIEALLQSSMRVALLSSKWRAEVAACYRNLRDISKQEATLQFLDYIGALPYGKALFFGVITRSDPLRLLPTRVVLAINQRGIHFFSVEPSVLLLTVDLHDLMHYGSSTSCVFFKVRVQQTMAVLQLETPQGEEICTSLQTFINDVFLERFKLKPKDGGMSEAEAREALEQPQDDVAQLKRQLQEVSKRSADWEAKAAALKKRNEEHSDMVTTEIEKEEAEEAAQFARTRKRSANGYSNGQDAHSEMPAADVAASRDCLKCEEQRIQVIGLFQRAEEATANAEAAEAAAVAAFADRDAAVEAHKQQKPFLQKMTERLDLVTTQAVRQATEIKRLEEDLANATAEKDRLASDLAQIREGGTSEAEALHEQLVDMRAQFADSEAQRSEAEAKVIDAQAQLWKLSTEAANSEEGVGKRLEAEIARFEEEARAAQEKAVEHGNELLEVNVELQEMKAALKAQQEAAETAALEARHTNDTLQQELDGAHAEVMELKQQLLESQLRADELSAAADTETELRKANEACNALKIELGGLRSQLNSQNSDNLVPGTPPQSVQEGMSSLEAAAWNTELWRLVEENDSLRERCAAYEKDVKELINSSHLGHANNKQKLQLHLRWKQDLEQLRQECTVLLRERFQLEQCIRYLAVRCRLVSNSDVTTVYRRDPTAKLQPASLAPGTPGILKVHSLAQRLPDLRLQHSDLMAHGGIGSYSPPPSYADSFAPSSPVSTVPRADTAVEDHILARVAFICNPPTVKPVAIAEKPSKIPRPKPNYGLRSPSPKD